MNKDVIYIDVEDDITAIIGKVKASKEKIVALVPPKRIGVLQSAVNLHLLVRMAKNADKQLVLVTNNQALIALSAAAAIPVAKNLQSKPELAEITALAVDDEEDIIDGSQLPVGELERTADGEAVAPKMVKINKLVDTIDVDSEESVLPVVAAATAPKRALPPKSNIKVPNFKRFRKRLFFGIAGLIVLVGFLVWANVFAPAATIVITAKTIPSPISQTVTLSSAATDVSKGTIQTVNQQLKKDVSVKFSATGQKDVGEKATGTMKVTRTSISNSSLNLPAGTAFTSSDDHTFYSTQGITLAATQVGSNGIIQDSGTVNVTAANSGPDYNLAGGSYQASVNGVSAQGSAMTGGTTKIATVVTDDDIQKAKVALAALPTDTDKAQLIAQFKNGEYVINDSFNVDHADAISTPASGAEADTQATLSSTTTYTITAIARPDIEQYLKSALNKQINGATDQRIYDDGISKVVVAGYSNVSSATTVNIATTGQVGPNIDPDAIKTQAKGKKSGEIQAMLQDIDGVSSVKVNFSYFWVTKVPTNTNKVDVQFKLTNG